MYQKLDRNELGLIQRDQERNGDRSEVSAPAIVDFSDYHSLHRFLYGKELEVGENQVVIGDEIFDVNDLSSAAEKNPQPASHPIKPHHYVLQDELNEMRRESERKAYIESDEYKTTVRELKALREKFPDLTPKKVSHP